MKECARWFKTQFAGKKSFHGALSTQYLFFFKWLIILTAFLKPEGILKMWLEEAPIQRLVSTEFPQPQGKVRIGIFFFFYTNGAKRI